MRASRATFEDQRSIGLDDLTFHIEPTDAAKKVDVLSCMQLVLIDRRIDKNTTSTHGLRVVRASMMTNAMLPGDPLKPTKTEAKIPVP